MTKTADRWFQVGRTCEQVDLKLFCFPYAGGSAHVFKQWADFLPPTVQLILVELPGRGSRLQEPAFVRLPDLMAELQEVIRPLLDEPYVLFGHSMGAIIAFELARILDRWCDNKLQALFVSGRRAPQISADKPATYNLPREEFIEELIKLDGTPREVLDHAELVDLMLPLLRADFQLVQTYNYSADAPLRCPITVYGGLHDAEVTREMLLPWKELTKSIFALHMLPGDHFFIRSPRNQFLNLLAKALHKTITHSRVNNL